MYDTALHQLHAAHTTSHLEDVERLVLNVGGFVSQEVHHHLQVFLVLVGKKPSQTRTAGNERSEEKRREKKDRKKRNNLY